MNDLKPGTLLYVKNACSLVVILLCLGRYHLQAFRHLYVLAAEPRVLVPREVDSNKACHVPLEVTVKVIGELIS